MTRIQGVGTNRIGGITPQGFWHRGVSTGRSRLRAVASATVLAGVFATAASPTLITEAHAAPKPSACSVRSFDHVRAGHLDFGPVLTGNGLTPAVKDDRSQPARWKRPGGMIIELGDNARRRLPSGLGFIGAAGSEVYMIPGVQMAGVPWLGWNTQHSSILSNVDADARFTLVAVRGPGKVAVFTSGSFGSAVGQRIFDTVGGPRSTSVPMNTHTHANWVFTKPGAYQLTMAFSVRTKSGQTRTGTATLNVAAGLKNSAQVFSGCGGAQASSGGQTGSKGGGQAAAAHSSGAGTKARGNGGSAGGNMSGNSASGDTSGNAAGNAGGSAAGNPGSTGLSNAGGSGGGAVGVSPFDAGSSNQSGAQSGSGASGSGSDTLGGDLGSQGGSLNDSGQVAPELADGTTKAGGLNSAAQPVLATPEEGAGNGGHRWSTLALGTLGGLAIVGAGAGTYRWASRPTGGRQ